MIFKYASGQHTTNRILHGDGMEEVKSTCGSLHVSWMPSSCGIPTDQPSSSKTLPYNSNNAQHHISHKTCSAV